MAQLVWDRVGERLYETGVDHGVLYHPNTRGAYDRGFAWNGLTTVTESPSGAESNPQYADNIKYLNLLSAEEFGCTIEAFTYPDEFAQNDGTAVPTMGVSVGQQARRPFGFSYRTRLGNDLDGTDHGYKLHLVYGAQAAPSEKAYATINDSPEAIAFSWEITTTPVSAGDDLKPTALIVIDSTQVDATILRDLERILYGTSGTEPRLPLPAEIIGMFARELRTVTPRAPTYDGGTGVITIPGDVGVEYVIGGEVVSSGAQDAIREDTIVTAQPASGYIFVGDYVDEWYFEAP